MGHRLVRFLPGLGFGAIVGAVVVVPSVFATQLANPFTTAKVTLLWLTAIVAVLGVVVLAVDERAWPFPRLRAFGPLALLVGWTALATALSETPMTSIVGSYGRYDGLVSLAAGVAIALALVAFTWRRFDRLEVVAAAVAVSGAIGLLYVFIERVGLDPIDWHLQGTGGWLVGLGGNPNFSGSQLALVAPVVVAARLRVEAPWARRALLGAALALAAGVWLTQTRGGIVALVGGVAVAGALVPELMPKGVRIGALAATAGLLILIVASALVPSLPGRLPFGSSAVLASGGVSQRTNIWAAAARMAEDHPVVGVGPDGFGREVYRYRSSRGGRQLIAADEAHDVYLDRAATAGLPALGAQVWLLVVVGLAGWRARRIVAAEHRWLVAAFGGLLAGYVLQGFFSIDATALVLLSWVGIGALLALGDPAVVAARAAGDGGRRPLRRASPAAPVVATIGTVVALVLCALAVRPAIADHHRRIGQDALEHGHALRALAADQRAASWLGHEPAFLVAQAEDLVVLAAAPTTAPELRRTLLDAAISAYGEALRRSPGDASVQVRLAEAHVLAAEAAADDEVAARHLDRGEATYRALLADLSATDDLHLPYGRLLEVRAVRASGADQARYLRAAAHQFELAEAYHPDEQAATDALARVRTAIEELEPS